MPCHSGTPCTHWHTDAGITSLLLTTLDWIVWSLKHGSQPILDMWDSLDNKWFVKDLRLEDEDNDKDKDEDLKIGPRGSSRTTTLEIRQSAAAPVFMIINVSFTLHKSIITLNYGVTHAQESATIETCASFLSVCIATTIVQLFFNSGHSSPIESDGRAGPANRVVYFTVN